MIYFIRNWDLYIVLNMVTIYNYAFTMLRDYAVTLFVTVESHSEQLVDLDLVWTIHTPCIITILEGLTKQSSPFSLLQFSYL